MRTLPSDPRRLSVPLRPILLAPGLCRAPLRVPSPFQFAGEAKRYRPCTPSRPTEARTCRKDRYPGVRRLPWRILCRRPPPEQVPGRNFMRTPRVGVRESEKYEVGQLQGDLLWPDSANYVAVAQQFGIPICRVTWCHHHRRRRCRSTANRPHACEASPTCSPGLPLIREAILVQRASDAVGAVRSSPIGKEPMEKLSTKLISARFS